MTNRDISRQLVEAGQALHGPQWKRPLARDLDVAESSVRDWTSGRRAPPYDLEERLDRLLKRGKAAGTLQIPARAQTACARKSRCARMVGAFAHSRQRAALTPRRFNARASQRHVIRTAPDACCGASINACHWRAAWTWTYPARSRLCRAARPRRVVAFHTSRRISRQNGNHAGGAGGEG